MRKSTSIALLILIAILVPLVYFPIASFVLRQPVPTLKPTWVDNTFLTEFQNPIWVDSDFSEGWNITWALGQTPGSYGFTSNQTGIGDLYATFNGFNFSSQQGLSGVMIEKTIEKVNTTVYPYLTIRHVESSANPSLRFSIGVVDESGKRYYEQGSQATLTWKNATRDLREICNGTINRVSILFTNDFNLYYGGGLQHTYLQNMGIYKEEPVWTITENMPVNASLSVQQGALAVRAAGNITAGTVASAQRIFDPANISINTRYLKVLIKTSAISVAARITVWISASEARLILLKTYDDRYVHTETIDLSYFQISVSQIQRIELGWQQVYSSEKETSEVWYNALSLNLMEWSY